MRFILIFIFISNQVIAQYSSTYPDNFSVYFNNLYLTDPSYVPSFGNFNMSLSNKAKATTNDIYTLSFHLEKVVRLRNYSSHLFRAIAFSEKEGPYISYPRFYINYARGIPIGEHIFIFAGAAFGIAGINFSPPSGSGSAKLPDASIGISMQHKNITFGVSSNQILNSSARVLSTPIKLYRYYNFHLEGNVKVGERIDLKIYSLWRSYFKMKDQWSIGGSLMYNKFIESGAVYKYSRGTTFFMNIQLFPDINPVFISFAYNTDLLGIMQGYNDSFEITLKYSINKGWNKIDNK